jgi:putative membrane-bound dehydrogenase-like protein
MKYLLALGCLISFVGLSVGLKAAEPAIADSDKAEKRIVFLAGNPSHDYGSHEHYAGCRILAAALQDNLKGVKCEVYRGGWPADESVLDGASTVIMYADGGGGHPVIPHQKKMAELMDKGVGLVCLHYGVEVPKGEPGNNFLNWLGGYFETDWSVNPHWVAEYVSLPKHPITRGVPPFKANDEWYFHMRFPEGMKNVTPILSAVAPASTMERPDGPHSGNPHVRKEVAAGIPQHMAWAFERPNGGRSFGFTGGHFHWNWGRPEILKLVSNAIVWTAKIEIPEDGVTVKIQGVDQLKEGQDEKVPNNFNADDIRKRFQLTSTQSSEAKQTANAPKPRKLFASPVVNTQTANHSVAADIDIKGVKQLFLVVGDAGDGFSCDWADWIEPTLVGASGTKKLTELKWRDASTQWGNVVVGKNAAGGPLAVSGKSYSDGIGTHANSVIAFEIPEGFDKLKVLCGLDEGGTKQGNATSVTFSAYADAVPDFQAEQRKQESEVRSPERAVAGLEVHSGLEATLVSSEPELLSLTNLDIDHRGRVWVCEVVNYRGHNGKRPQGDRILVMEDTDQDGKSDKSTVFYQGNEVDSAMGICVLGNRVIVSASPNVWIFTDENGDDKADKKELLFSNTGQPQHDHSAHSIVFGPDGKLYWNFGNTGKAVHDAAGKPVVDKMGNTVVDNGKPYFGGMVFRCDADGSNFEVLGHNFRNNYEAAVDSFGTIWQSDNDDDGNRATRINYVMEFGNYGYRDELTGAGWQAERTGWESEIPQRHWHLNDPGVVPTMLITGAGSPTGITVYEGRLLPEVFWDQPLHCDAGPNVVRAYVTSAEGAGYSAKIENLVVGERDRWFRPADVAVAPDGSVFITDWYDPGVGGHAMGDLDRGRLFRVAPPGTKYIVPKFDFAKLEDCLEALKNPCQSIRYMAWQSLHSMGEKAEAGLKTLWQDSNPRVRARALWLLGKIEGRGKRYVEIGIADKDENIRITAVRLARQLGLGVNEFVSPLVDDSSAAVRRELAIALHGDKSEAMPALWAKLAQKHDGKDRWYLEALGIAAEKRWDECLASWKSLVGDSWKSPSGKQVIWRSRSNDTAKLLVELLSEESLSDEDSARYFRALDYQETSRREAALKELLGDVSKP